MVSGVIDAIGSPSNRSPGVEFAIDDGRRIFGMAAHQNEPDLERNLADLHPRPVAHPEGIRERIGILRDRRRGEIENSIAFGETTAGTSARTWLAAGSRGARHPFARRRNTRGSKQLGRRERGDQGTGNRAYGGGLGAEPGCSRLHGFDLNPIRPAAVRGDELEQMGTGIAGEDEV